MNRNIDVDPYFDDEDEENEEVYRSLMKGNARLPACDPLALPFSSIYQSCILCSRIEAEHILETRPYVQLGNFIVRPSIHANHPYSLTVLCEDNKILHFQIGKIANEYALGPLERNHKSTKKTFPSVSAFLEYHTNNPVKFQDSSYITHSVLLTLYSAIETTRM